MAAEAAVAEASGAALRGRLPRAEAAALDDFLAAASAGSAVRLWAGAAAAPALLADPDRLRALLDRDIAAIDTLISRQVNALIHAPAFQALEAGWRGLRYLVGACEGALNVKLRVLSVAWPEVVSDLERDAEFDQSEIFEKIYSQEFGIAGGEPFGLIVGNYFLSHRRSATHPSDDVAALRALAGVAAAAFVPFVAGLDPAMLGLDRFASLGADLDLDAVFQQAEYARWRSLREMEDARFLGLCLPRILMRLPWPDAPAGPMPFRFQEECAAPEDDGCLWGNAAFAFAAVAIRAFSQSGWFAEIRGAPRGEIAAGIVADLPIDSFATDRPGIAFKHPLETAISDRQEKSLGDLGFVPLSVADHAPYVVFYGNQSVQRPQRAGTLVATINARLSSMLQYMLCIGRFAHAIKVIGRERTGSFATAEECEKALQTWLSDYVTANPTAPLELKIKYPLREGRVSVTERPDRPGVFKMDIYLRPHLQLDEISSGIRLTTELNLRRAA